MISKKDIEKACKSYMETNLVFHKDMEYTRCWTHADFLAGVRWAEKEIKKRKQPNIKLVNHANYPDNEFSG